LSSLSVRVKGAVMLPDLPPLWVVPAAFAISVAGSLGGLSGAFLLLPFQVDVLGIAGPGATSTNHLFNVLAVPAGLASLGRRRRVVWPLALAVVAGTIPGVVLGAALRLFVLSDPGLFRLFAAAVLGSSAAWLLARPSAARTGGALRDPAPAAPVRVLRSSWHSLTVAVGAREHEVSPPAVLALSLVVGGVGGAYGIGGGAILAPLLVATFGLPVQATSGATLLGTWVSSSAALLAYLALPAVLAVPAAAPDWALGGMLGVGGMAGIACGTRLQTRIRSLWIERGLALLLAGIALRQAWEGLCAVLS
jgi:uncharacterized membrane protein YfcA